MNIGFIVQAKSQQRVLELLDNYTQRIFNDFHAAEPVPEKFKIELKVQE